MAFGTVNVGGGSYAGSSGTSIYMAKCSSQFSRSHVSSFIGYYEPSLTIFGAPNARVNDILIVEFQPSDETPYHAIFTITNADDKEIGNDIRKFTLRAEGIITGENGVDGERGASIFMAARSTTMNNPKHYERSEVPSLNGTEVTWTLNKIAEAKQGDIIIVSLPGASSDVAPNYVFGKITGEIEDVSIAAASYTMRINGYILSGEKGADGERGASVITAKSAGSMERESIPEMNGRLVAFDVTGDPTAKVNDILFVEIPDSEDNDPHYVFGTCIADAVASKFGPSYQFVTFQVNGYILSAEKSSGADLERYFKIPSGVEPASPPMETLFIVNSGGTERTVDYYTVPTGIKTVINENRTTVEVPAYGSVALRVLGSEFAIYGEEEIYRSESITLDRASVGWRIYKIDTCGVMHITQSHMYCLTGDTLVTMADGSEKRLDDICVGDEVLSFDWDSMKLVPNKVIETDRDEGKTHTCYDKWTFSDGTVIKTVHRHEFYCVESRGMKYMDEWKLGEHTYRKGGRHVALVAHETIEETVRHYKITLENGTNYFANGLLTGDRNNPNGIIL